MTWLAKHSTSSRAQELGDIQGLVLHGYKYMNVACLLFLRIDAPEKCGRWLAETVPRITSSAHNPRASAESICLNVAFTRHGLEALGLKETLETFPPEFVQGMAGRQRELGDTDASAPEHWDFGGTRPEGPREDALHVLLLLYARTPRRLEWLLENERQRLADSGLTEVGSQQAARVFDAEGHETEHFGFRDALSQPLIKGVDERRKTNSYDDPLNAGEFVLGHTNEYGERPDGPRVRASTDPGRWLHALHGEPGWRDLGRNGSFLVLRKLEEDVRSFWDFIQSHPLAQTDGKPDPHKAQWLAAKLVGRWPNGAPLRPGETEEPHLHGRTVDNDFLYAHNDPQGFGCPVTSHVRRTNPRDSLPPDPEHSLTINRRTRILRRGIPYSDARGQGILFMAINANIGRQFEFIHRNWMLSAKHQGLDDRDFVAQEGPGQVTLAGPGLRQRVHGGLARFVTTRGGGYFFVPSLRALEFLADFVPGA